MMKRILVCLLALPTARAETTLSVGLYVLPEAFSQAHSEVKAELSYEFDE